jgi:hypothetical protein
MFRWVQIPPAEVERMVHEDIVEKGIEAFGTPAVTMPNSEQHFFPARQKSFHQFY